MAEITLKTQTTSLWPFDDLPEGVKKWLTSDNVRAVVEELNVKLKLTGNLSSVIPYCITWLAVKTIKPEEFTATLANELGWTVEKTREISVTVKDRILKPIDSGLKKEVGVDIAKIDVGSAKPIKLDIITPTEAPTTAQVIKLSRPIPRQSTPPVPTKTPQPTNSSTVPNPTILDARKPFMLHEEKSAAGPVVSSANFSLTKDSENSPTPSFSYRTIESPAVSQKSQEPVSSKFGTTAQDISKPKTAPLQPNRMAPPQLIPKITQFAQPILKPTPQPTAPKKSESVASPTPIKTPQLNNSQTVPRIVHYTKFRSMLEIPTERKEKLLEEKKG